MAMTHKDLLRNPNLLLSNRLPVSVVSDKCLGSACLAAVLNDDYSCITTSSCDFIPDPPLDGNVLERTDLFFAHTDFLVWPQPYNPLLPHLPLIHCRQSDIYETDRSFLWTLPDSGRDFIRHSQELCTGLGQLSPSSLSRLTSFENSLLNRMARFDSTAPTGLKTVLFRQLLFESRALFSRLESLIMGFRSMCRTVRALQRTLLEIEAYLDYLDVITCVAPPTPRASVGAYVYNIEHAQKLDSLGIRHWLIRPSEDVLQTTHVKKIATLLHPPEFDLSIDPLPNASPIYVGPASSSKMYEAIKYHGRNCIRFPDPFHSQVIPEPIVSKIGPSRSLPGHRALTYKQRLLKSTSDKGKDRFKRVPRSKFEDPACLFYPPSLEHWARAQLAVDTHSSNFAYESMNSDGAYVVPEPASMVSTEKEEKSMALFRSWLKYRPVLIFRLAFQYSQVSPKHGRAWNALLAAEYLSGLQSDFQPGDRAREREKLKDEMLSFLSSNTDSDSDVQLTENFRSDNVASLWQDIPFEQMQTAHLEQILWELAEINFRYEFQALDFRARRNTPFENDKHVHESLMACVPDGSFSVPSLLTANHGIASRSRRERAHYLFSMARVMSKWKWVNLQGQIVKVHQLKWTAAELDELEKEIAVLYTQSFYNCFRRAAVLPRRLSQAAVEACPVVGRAHIPCRAPCLDNEPATIVNSYPVLYPS